MTATILTGDALTMLRTLPDGAVRCCVTSPPYWGLRDYGHAGQLGCEPTPEQYVENMVAVFREVRRVLSDDGTLWLNLGDSYARAQETNVPQTKHPPVAYPHHAKSGSSDGAVGRADRPGTRAGGKPKDLLGIPWRVAFALQADGWYLRSDIIWSKPNPMPESVTDRPTKSHEYLFLLSKSARYYYNAEAIAEPLTASSVERLSQPTLQHQLGSDRVPGKTNGNMKAVPPRRSGNKERKGGEAVGLAPGGLGRSIPWEDDGAGRNARSVWTIATQPYKGAHFATFPEELARRCIMAGSAPGDTVLDPFGGSGTVGQVATGNGRAAILIELNPAYVALMEQRIGRLMVAP